METFIDDLVDARSLSEATRRSYTQTLVSLAKTIGEDPSVHPLWLYDRCEDICDYLNGLLNPNSVKSKLSAILSGCRYGLVKDGVFTNLQQEALNKYKEISDSAGKESDELLARRRNGAAAPNWVELVRRAESLWEEVGLPLINKAKLNDYALSQMDLGQLQIAMLCQMGVFVSPRRSKDYALLKVARNKPESDLLETKGNYLLINQDDDTDEETMDFLFCQYKMQKAYGPQRLPISNELRLKIRKYLPVIAYAQNRRAMDDGYWVFIKVTTNRLPEVKHIQQTYIGEMLKKGLDIGVSSLRSSFISYRCKGDKRLEENEQLAREMGHSVRMQQEVYRRYNIEGEDEEEKDMQA